MQLLLKLKVWLAYILTTGSQTPLQIELPSVLILSGLRVVDAHDCTWVHANRVFSFVSELGVVGCVCWRRRTCCQYLGWVLLVATCLDSQALDSSSDVSRSRSHHRRVSCIGRRNVGHLQRWDLGQVADYLLVLLAVFDSRRGCTISMKHIHNGKIIINQDNDGWPRFICWFKIERFVATTLSEAQRNRIIIWQQSYAWKR